MPGRRLTHPEFAVGLAGRDDDVLSCQLRQDADGLSAYRRALQTGVLAIFPGPEFNILIADFPIRHPNFDCQGE
jgi:hypothetical protein